MDCPESDGEIEACYALCQADPSCNLGCYESLPDETQDALDELVECQALNCFGPDVVDFETCQFEACSNEMATCYFSGVATCGEVFHTCIPECNPGDQGCVSGCYETLTGAGWIDSKSWQSCRLGLCDEDGDGEPDSAQCNLLASYSACYTSDSSCFGAEYGTGGGNVSCSIHQGCIRGCLETYLLNPYCVYGCVTSATDQALALSAPLTHCVLESCGTTPSGECYDQKVMGACFDSAMMCGVQGLTESCDNHIDDDGNGLTDCEDPACANYLPCLGEPFVEMVCDDMVDNDGDGKTDCDDLDCFGVGGCSNLSGAAYLLITDALTECTSSADNGSPGAEIDSVILTKGNGSLFYVFNTSIYGGGLCQNNANSATSNVYGPADFDSFALNGSTLGISFGGGVQLSPGDLVTVIEGGLDSPESYTVSLGYEGTEDTVWIGEALGSESFTLPAGF